MKKRFVLSLIILIISFAGCKKEEKEMKTDMPIKEINLQSYKWENRPLLIFTESEKSKLYQSQMKEFEGNERCIDERDMILISIFSNEEVQIDNKKYFLDNYNELLKKFSFDKSDFALILIGKDGTVKLKSEKPIEANKIFDLIDSMPMRKREMEKDK